MPYQLRLTDVPGELTVYQSYQLSVLPVAPSDCTAKRTSRTSRSYQLYQLTVPVVPADRTRKNAAYFPKVAAFFAKHCKFTVNLRFWHSALLPFFPRIAAFFGYGRRGTPGTVRWYNRHGTLVQQVRCGGTTGVVRWYNRHGTLMQQAVHRVRARQ